MQWPNSHPDGGMVLTEELEKCVNIGLGVQPTEKNRKTKHSLKYRKKKYSKIRAIL